MYRSHEKISAGGVLMLLLTLLNAVLLEKSFIANNGWYKVMYITFPLLLVVIIAVRKKQI